VIRILVADGLILAAGNGLVTVVAGPSRRVFGVAGRLGVSFLAGVSLLATVTTVLAVLGLPTTPPATAPLLVVAALAGALPLFVPGALSPLRQRFQAPYRPLLQLGGELLAAVPALWIGLKAVAGGAKIPVVVSDEYAIWALRGRMLSLAGHFDARIGFNGMAGYNHPDYPLGVPALVAWSDGWMGKVSDPAAHAQVALMFLAMLLIAAWAGNRFAGPLGGIAAVLMLGGLTRVLPRYAVLLFGDIPVAAYALAMVAVAAVWLDERNGRILGVVGVLAAGAVLVKNEGSLAAVAALGAVTLANVGRGREWKPVAYAWAAAIGALLPWMVFTRAHGAKSDVVNGDTLAPHAIRAHLHLFRPILTGFKKLWPGVRGVAAVLPFVAAAAALTTRQRRLVTLFGGTLGLSFAGLVFVYLGGYAHLYSSAHRTLLAPASVAALSIPVLAGAAMRKEPEPPATESQQQVPGNSAH
jgi:hypothetical protein